MSITQKVRSLRQSQTDAEQKFWSKVRNRQINGYKFYRQRQIGFYTVDFVCRDVDLVVEIDGGQHCENMKDIARTEYLNKKGYKVIRFWNNEVLENMDGVLYRLQEEIESLTPSLSLKGEGA